MRRMKPPQQLARLLATEPALAAALAAPGSACDLQCAHPAHQSGPRPARNQSSLGGPAGRQAHVSKYNQLPLA